MRNDSRLSRLLHVLIHMGQRDEPVTSEMIAEMLCTNAVVVRRTMAGLREHGFVQSAKGHGGGWSLTHPIDKITLLDVYRTLGEPALFAFGAAQDNPRCLVEQAVNAAIANTLDEAEALMLNRFAQLTVGDIARDFQKRYKKIGAPHAATERHAGGKKK